MTIFISQNKKRECIYSSLFMLSLILCFLGLEIKDGCIAVIIAILPIALIVLIKILSLIRNMLGTNNVIFLELDDDRIRYYSKRGVRQEILLSDIKDIQIDDDVLHFYLNENVKESRLRRLLRYYIENLANVVQIPILCDEKELDIFLQKVKQDNYNLPVNKDIDSFVGLCVAYICILLGAFWFFFLQAVWGCTLATNIIKLIIISILVVVMHFYNKNYLYNARFNFGSFTRCILASLFLAQYILCACQIEEIIKSTNLKLTSSWQSVGIIGLLYIIMCLLFIPENGLGRKIIKKFINIRRI